MKHSFILFSNYELYCQHNFLIEKFTEMSECLSSFLKSWIGFKLLDQLVYYVKMNFAYLLLFYITSCQVQFCQAVNAALSPSKSM